ncbi:hypothetical protein BC941DRAFT_435548 [Chlamydoabsidia padenii]|nr:hypothetical protein BC941DRAFT_435548 [Chlamydoabsidia padenii]
MVGCCSHLRFRYIKHARLVNQCYPKKEGEVGPRSAELSYLTFYASSRPAKLTKVGTYLYNKVHHDIRKGRKENNKVSLLILKALIQSCHRDLNLFCRSAIVILNELLDTRDIELIDSACDTFYAFCNYYDGSNLGIDSVFTNDYENIVRRFASFAVYNNDDGLQMRYSGHRALAAIVNSSTITSNDLTVILGILIPPLLATIDTTSQSAWNVAKSGPSIDIRCSVYAVENLTMAWIEQLAAQTLSLLFSLSNGTGVRSSLLPCKEFFTSKQKWWPTEFCESISELILQSIQPQYRYLMLMNVLSYLHEPVDMADVSQVDRFVGSVAILRTILTSSLELMGIPVLELLTALYTLMMRSLAKTGAIYDKKPTCQQPEQLKHYSVQHDLFESIVGLASQSYYSNQWNDIISYIITKLRNTSSLPMATHGDDEEKVGDQQVPDYLYQQCSVRFLDIFQTNALKALESEPADAHSVFMVEIWTPGLEILYDPYQDIRLQFADTLIHMLDSTLKKNTDYLSSLYTSFHHGNPTFIHQLLKSIFVWARLDTLDTRDMMAIHQLLHCIPKRFNGYGIIRTFPFIFALQEVACEFNNVALGNMEIGTSSNIDSTINMDSFLDCDMATPGESVATGYVTATDATDSINSTGTTNSGISPSGDDDAIEHHSTDTSQHTETQTKNPSQQQSGRIVQQTQRQCYLAAITLDWMISVGEVTGMGKLLDYLANIKDTRQQKRQVPSVDLTRKPTLDAPTIDTDAKSVTEWMDRQKVVEAILDDGKLHDIKGPPGMNLEDKLYVKWGSEAYDNQEKSFRIETDTNADMKPKLTPAFTNTTLQRQQQQEDKPVINVENLKGALAAQLLGNEQDEEKQQIQDNHDTTNVKNELNHLLSGLHASTPREHSLSLVNPPY